MFLGRVVLLLLCSLYLHLEDDANKNLNIGRALSLYNVLYAKC